MFNTKVATEYELIREVEELLFKHIGPAKTTRFWTAFNKGSDDYLTIKEKLFTGETIDTLYRKIEKYQKAK